jgi:hypothetical protein
MFRTERQPFTLHERPVPNSAILAASTLENWNPRLSRPPSLRLSSASLDV